MKESETPEGWEGKPGGFVFISKESVGKEGLSKLGGMSPYSSHYGVILNMFLDVRPLSTNISSNSTREIQGGLL